jgi:adenylate cyclase
VSRETGARYVLEGSARRAGDRLRVTAQLVDISSGAHLWAERYDRTLADVFDVQDELVGKIVSALRSTLGAASPTPAP